MRAPVSLAIFLTTGLALSMDSVAAELPLQSITLYQSGVGYFELSGAVEGNETVQLSFQADRINDILKSMVLLDFGGGEIAGATYQPLEILQRRLEQFRINPLSAGSMHDLFLQLRGQQVVLKTTGGEARGTVMGVQKRPTIIGVGEKPSVVDDWAVTLLTKTGVTSIATADIRSFELQDESLAAELAEAFAIVADHQNTRSTEISLNFKGAGERNVAVAYTHEAPVWKTSYRLILPDGTNTSPSLQGWAIVENDTDDDWEDVRLSLASGRPVSFVMDLQTPLILDRPNVPVPVMALLAPQVFESGRAEKLALQESGARRFDAAAPIAAAENHLQWADRAASSGMSADDMIDYGADAAATAGELGEQFMYTIDAPVSIKRGQSSMLPILSSPIEGRRLTIYSWRGPNSRPMRGVEFTNTTGLHLMAGPIAVYDSGAYAGDAQIQHIARGDERLISYAVDHDLNVSYEQKMREDTTKIRIVNGLIERTYSSKQSTTYTFVNHDTDPRLVMLEHPKMAGWELLGKEPVEVTDSLYRFEMNVGAGESAEFTVTLERVWSQHIGTDSIGLDELLAYVRNGKASQAVYDAVRTAATLRGEINSLTQQINDIDLEIRRISDDQSRIRSNMGAVGRQAELYARLLSKLEEQETRMDEIQTQRMELRDRQEQKTRELQQFLRNLNVE